MADNFGLKIGIEGEREFKSALREINQSFKVLASEMNLVSSQFSKNDKSIQAATARNQVLNKEIDAQKDKITALEKALANATTSFGENDSRTKAWAAQLNNAKAELNGMERELRNNERSLMSNAEKYAIIGAEIDATAREYVKVREEFGKNSAEAKTLEARLRELSAEQRDAGKAADAEDKAVTEVTKSLGLYERMTDSAGDKTSRFSTILKGAGVALGAMVVAAGAAAIKLGKEVIRGLGELEQNLGGSEAVFGKYAASVQKTGEDAYRNLGVSQSHYLAIANKIGALLQGTGIEQVKSLEITEKAMQRAADVASVMGIDMTMALDSVAGAAKGNFTMMDNLGVAMNATNIQAYALSKGLDFTWKTATQAEKAEIAMQMFFERTEQYAGNFARESTQTITGSLGMLQAAVGSFAAGLGNANADMTNLTQNVVDSFQAVVANIVPVLQNIVSVMPQVTGALLAALTALLPMLLQMGTKIIQSLLTGLVQALPSLTSGAAQLITGVTQGIIDNLPTLAGAAMLMIATLASELASALPALIPAAANAVKMVIQTLLQLLPELVLVGAEMMSKLAEGLGNAIPLIKPITTAISGMINVLKILAPYLAAVAAGLGAFHIILTVTEMLRGMTLATTAHTIASAAQAIAVKIVTAAQWLWNAAMAANPIGLLIAGVAALAAGIAVLVGWFNRESEEQKALKESTKNLIDENNRLNESIGETGRAYEDRLGDMARDAGAASSLTDKIAKLSAVENKSARQKQQLAAYVGMLNEAMGESVLEYNAETDAMSRNLNEIYGIIAARQEEAKLQAARERAVEIAKEQLVVGEQLNKIERQRIELDEAIAAGTIKKSFYNAEIKKLTESEAELIVQQDDLIVSFDNATLAVTEAADKQRAANAMISESAAAMTDDLIAAHAVQDELSRKRVEQEQITTEAMIKAASEQGLSLDEYKTKLESTQREEEEAYKKREETLIKYTDTATEMFNRLDDKVTVTVKQMTANMKHNQKIMESWADNLAVLADRGVNKGLLDRLRAAGPESASTVAALVKASDTEIAELNTVFANGSKVATDALLKQLGLPEVVNSGSDMVDDISEGVTKNNALTEATIKLIQDSKNMAETAIRNSGFDGVGRMMVDSVYQGFSQRGQWFRNQVTTFFKGVVNSVKSDMGINSRSTVYMGIGANMAQGLGDGFAQRMNQVSRDMRSAVPRSFDVATSLDARSAVSDGMRSRSVAGAKSSIVQNINVTSPKPLSERELAREFRNLSRKLALGVE